MSTIDLPPSQPDLTSAVNVGPMVDVADAASLRAHLDDLLADSLRRATTRAEHIRLVRIQTAVAALYGVNAA